MKKILPYILMFTVIANIFAPFSIGVSQIQKAYAEDPKDIKNICTSITDLCGTVSAYALTSQIDKNSNQPLTGGTIWVAAGAKTSYLENGINDDFKLLVVLRFKDASGKIVSTYANSNKTLNMTEYIQDIKGTEFTTYQTAFFFKDLQPNTTYTTELIVVGKSEIFYDTLFNTSNNEINALLASSIEEGKTLVKSQEFTTPPVGEKRVGDETGINLSSTKISYDLVPECGGFWPTSDGTFTGCIAEGLYYVLFVPTSYIFAFSGMFFDFTFGYSVNDSSYRKQFVVEGWALVRDFCNMFFIFVLLYVAFATILDIHHFDTKGMIINVVIIGVLINFSLFAAQFIIDTSNILARVFYNSQAISIQGDAVAVGTNGSNLYTADQNGNLPLSAALVNKVDPQNLIINANKINDIRETGKGVDMTNESGGLGVGTFILVTLLATAVNIVGIVTFLSIGLIFVARVIGLYFSMIFAPFAFFSYTVPQMQSMDMIGWKNWWPDLLKMSFLAPIFMLFMYLILGFLDKGLSLVDTNGLTGIDWVVATIIPFAFVMIMLLQAKDIAKKFSGTIGQTVTGAVAAVGGVALGGAALGTAVLGRGLGGFIARTSRGETATQKYEAGTAKGMAKYTGWVGSKIGMGKVFGNAYNTKTKLVDNGLGGLLNKKQKHVGDIDHARHELDELQKKAGLEGVTNLSGAQEQKIKKLHDKENYAKAEKHVRENSITYVNASGQTNTVQGEEGYKSAERASVSRRVKASAGPGDVDTSGNLTDQGKKKVENELQLQFNGILKQKSEKKLNEDYDHLKTEAKEKVSGIDRGVSQINTGSWDLRNLSQIKQDKREGVVTKLSTSLLSGTATSIRSTLKATGADYSTGQKDFLKDLKKTLADALKGVADIKISTGGDGHDDHGGGH